MVELPRSFKVFEFRSGLEVIREAFRASDATMDAAMRSADEAEMAYLDSGEDEEEYDEDGILVWTKANELDDASRQALIASRAVREAFVTAAFHYWERSARSLTGLHKATDTFPVLRKAMKKKYPVSHRLTHVNILNNLLKHGSEGHAVSLSTKWPELFRPPLSGRGNVPFRARLTVSASHVEEVFQIILDSGPADMSGS